MTFAFIGGGFAGLVTGARLKQAGIDDVLIIEGGGDVGGAWYWNRYPGAMCDTAAMVYLPLLEETGHMPTQKYVFAPEIFGQAKRIATTFGLYDNALFSTAVTSLDWDDESGRWIIATDRGDRISAKYVGMGTGPLHRPKLPGIPGIETFGGHCFHTSRWDYAYTGGSYEGTPDDEPRRPTGGHHRHRCHRRAVHPAARARFEGTVRVPANARRRSTYATTIPSIPNGSPHCSRVGSSSG